MLKCSIATHIYGYLYDRYSFTVTTSIPKCVDVAVFADIYIANLRGEGSFEVPWSRPVNARNIGLFGKTHETFYFCNNKVYQINTYGYVTYKNKYFRTDAIHAMKLKNAYYYT